MTVSELARRLCAGTHPYRPNAGPFIPCGPHRMMAERFMWLISDDGCNVWDILDQARKDLGIATPPPLPPVVLEPDEPDWAMA